MTSERYGEAFNKGFAYTIRFLQSRGASHDRAEEVAQAAWTKGWERLAQLRNECLVCCWVNAIALNEFRRGIRKASFDAPLEDMCGQIGIDYAAIDAATILKLCHPRDQILLTHQMRGLTTEEIAKTLGATKTAIRIRLLRARRAARRQAVRTTFRGGASQDQARRTAA